MQDFSVQQVAEQPDHRGAQLTFPAVTTFDVVQQAPRFLESLTPEGVKALTATCAQLRQGFRSSVTVIQVTNEQDTALLCADKWPSLVMVVTSTTFALGDRLYSDRFKSNLIDKGWSIIVLLQLLNSLNDPTNWMSAGQQNVALIVSASHQSSPDIDTKAHGSALARFATKWEAKTRSMYMNLESKSVHMQPSKHLQFSKWPCLESITSHGNYDSALPTSCFSHESSSHLQFATLSLCSLDAEAVQSLITVCPLLFGLTLAACKPEAAVTVLKCLSQARFSSLHELNLSQNLLGCSGVQLLSSCHLPALQSLTLDDTNLNALAAMYLAQGQWPNLQQLHLFDNQLNVEAIAYLVKGEGPLLWDLGVPWKCVPEAAFEVLGVANACKQFEYTQLDHRQAFKQCLLFRSSFVVWPRLKVLTLKSLVVRHSSALYVLQTAEVRLNFEAITMKSKGVLILYRDVQITHFTGPMYEITQ